MTHQLEINFVYEEKKNERLRYKRDVNLQRRLNDLFVEAESFSPIMRSKPESVSADLITEKPRG